MKTAAGPAQLLCYHRYGGRRQVAVKRQRDQHSPLHGDRYWTVHVGRYRLIGFCCQYKCRCCWSRCYESPRISWYPIASPYPKRRSKPRLCPCSSLRIQFAGVDSSMEKPSYAQVNLRWVTADLLRSERTLRKKKDSDYFHLYRFLLS